MDAERISNAPFAELAAWTAEAGLEGLTEAELLSGFCTRAVADGLPLARAAVIIDTLHPVYEGRVFTWQRDQAEIKVVEYGRSDEGEAGEKWRRSPFYRLVQTGDEMLRQAITPATEAEFPILRDFGAAGMTEYLAVVKRFGAAGIIGEMDCVYSSWVTDAQNGFGDLGADEMLRLVPILALAMKSASLARIAATLVETYLGRDAGRRVLRGRIGRGVTDRIEAVLWFSDLRDYTRITEAAGPGEIIPMLNDYADAVISAVHAKGGDVLKLIGDGILAMFTADNLEIAGRAALAAAKSARRDIAVLNRRRSAESLPVTEMYLGLHVGEVYYGNVGSTERLDFTVVGPAVNEASRIAAMCRLVEQHMLCSSAFASAIGEARQALVSVGRYALRGVGRPQDLFTLDPEYDLR